MEKISCSIIRDLIPSYVDEVCSEETKTCVEHHMEECRECRERVAVLKGTELSADRLQRQELNSAKKVKRHVQAAGLLSCFSLFLTVAGVFFVFERAIGETPEQFYFLALPIFMIWAYVLEAHQTKKISPGFWDVCMGMLSFLAGGYAVFILLYSFSSHGQVFGIAVSRLGPFLYRQFVGLAIFQMLILIGTLVKTVTKGFVTSILSSLSLTGIFLSLSLCSLLKRLDSVLIEGAQFFVIKMVLIIGFAGTVFLYATDKIRWHRRKEGGAIL